METHGAKDILTAVAYRNVCVSKSTDIGGTLYAEGNTEGRRKPPLETEC